MADPIVLFFALGFIARLIRSDLRLPEAIYEALTVYLLLAIGLKGGVELGKVGGATIAVEIGTLIVLGALIPLVAYAVLRMAGRMNVSDAGAIAGHYGSASVVTFAVGQAFLLRQNVPFEAQSPVWLAVMEVPGIIVGILLARSGSVSGVKWGAALAEVLRGKSVVLLAGGLAIGAVAADRFEPLKAFFVDPFRGVLALFMLEMGLITASRVRDVMQRGVFLIAFGTLMPLVSACAGIAVAHVLNLSLGGTVLVATIAASASYIAAPAAMRLAVPEANPALAIGASLGVTFPFNVAIGIPLYYAIAKWLGGAA